MAIHQQGSNVAQLPIFAAVKLPQIAVEVLAHNNVIFAVKLDNFGCQCVIPTIAKIYVGFGGRLSVSDKAEENAVEQNAGKQQSSDGKSLFLFFSVPFLFFLIVV